jgi:hypothetical protein
LRNTTSSCVSRKNWAQQPCTLGTRLLCTELGGDLLCSRLQLRPDTRFKSAAQERRLACTYVVHVKLPIDERSFL